MAHRKIYLNYWKIGQKSYWEKVEFVEKSGVDLNLIDYEDRNEIEYDYLNALFELGKYEKLLSKIDPSIEHALEENPKQYLWLLSKKAAALFNVNKDYDAKYISKQVLSIDPENLLAQSVLLRCIRRHEMPNYQSIRAISNFLLLLAAMAISICWLLIAPFHPQYKNIATTFVKVLVTSAFVTLLINEFFYQFRGSKEWKQTVQKLKRKNALKKNNS